MFAELVNDKLKQIDEKFKTDVELLERFRYYVMGEEDEELFRINAYQLADHLGVDRRDLLVLLLQSTQVGLFDLNWDVHCPHCDGVTERNKKLFDMRTLSYCSMCEMNFNVAFDESVEVTFTINKNIKNVELPVNCGLPDQIKAEVRAELPGNHDKTVICYLEPDIYTFMCPVSKARGSIIVFKEVSKEVETIDITFDGTKFSPDLFELDMGSVTFLLKNQSDKDIGFYLYKKAQSNLDLSQLEDRVFGFECANIPEFRELFKDDVLSHRENMQLSDLTILFTDITGSTGLYEKLGDVIAYNIVRDHFDILFKAVENNDGVVVKTI
ncbi:MAG: DUF5939 domain-containing protein, partial [Spirochaetota bacterium]|nr:DUF5939 domain-containing protein [Spirochaetota bacterium]